jgi:hypothetical protein
VSDQVLIAIIGSVTLLVQGWLNRHAIGSPQTALSLMLSRWFFFLEVTAAIPLAIGVAALGGYYYSLDNLRTWGFASDPMAFNTAVAIIFLGSNELLMVLHLRRLARRELEKIMIVPEDEPKPKKD